MYPNDLKCGYNISSLSRSYAYSTVTIIFDELDMEFHEKCDYDFVLVSRCIEYANLSQLQTRRSYILIFMMLYRQAASEGHPREHESTAKIWLDHGYCQDPRKRKEEGSRQIQLFLCMNPEVKFAATITGGCS